MADTTPKGAERGSRVSPAEQKATGSWERPNLIAALCYLKVKSTDKSWPDSSQRYRARRKETQRTSGTWRYEQPLQVRREVPLPQHPEGAWHLKRQEHEVTTPKQFIGTTWAGGGGFTAKTFLMNPTGCCWPAELEQSNVLWWGISQPLALCEETLLGFDLSSARLIWNPLILVSEEKRSIPCLLTSRIVVWDWRGPSFFEYSHSVSLITLGFLWTFSSPFSRWDGRKPG